MEKNYVALTIRNNKTGLHRLFHEKGEFQGIMHHAMQKSAEDWGVTINDVELVCYMTITEFRPTILILLLGIFIGLLF